MGRVYAGGVRGDKDSDGPWGFALDVVLVPVHSVYVVQRTSYTYDIT